MLGNVRQSDFAFGELSPEHAASDSEAKQRSLKHGRNLRILNSYGFSQRHGSRWRATCAGQGVLVELMTSLGDSLVGILRAGGLDVYSTEGGLIQSVEGAPWSAAEALQLVWHIRADELYVTHQSYWPRRFAFNAGIWTLADVPFGAGVGGSLLQSYYRFAAPGITLRPSALTGDITVAFSAPVLQSAHVGIRFRYSGSELVINTVTDSQNAAATVITDLPQTVNVIPGDGSGYLVGEDVEGFDSKARGIITGISTLSGAGGAITATANSNSLWDGNVSIGAGGGGYVAGQVGIVAHYSLAGEGARKSSAATGVTVSGGAITAATFPATQDGLKPFATNVTFTISTKMLTVFMTSGLTGFFNGETLVGTRSSSPIATGPNTATPAAITEWDEAVFSDVRGYPGDVFERSGRLGFTDFPQIRDGILLSAPGDLQNFNVGEGGPQDAIFWRSALGSERILYCISATNLVVLTDRRICYVPENDAAPLQASTFALLEISPNGSSTAFPVVVDEGVIFVEYGGNRIMGAYITGQVAAPWAPIDLSRRGSHLINNPIALAMTGGNPQCPERYVFALNSNGTLACMFYDKDPARLGWTPWDTAGSWVSMIGVRGVIYQQCLRSIGGTTKYLLEQLDINAQMDASERFSDSGGAITFTFDDGSDWLDDNGDAIQSDVGALPHLAGQTVKVIRSTEYLGEVTVDSSGALPGIDASDGDFEAGLHFDVNAVLWPPSPEKDTSQFFGRRRVNRCAVRVQESCVYSIGIEGRSIAYTRPAYDQGDDLGAAPPLRSELKRFVLTGYEHEPAIQILRPLPQPLTVISVATEVTVR